MRVLAVTALLTGLCAVAAGTAILAVHSPNVEWLPDDYGRDVVLNGRYGILEDDTSRLVEYPVTVSRSQQVIGIDGRRVTIRETKKSTTLAGELPLAPLEAVVEFAVDMETHTYVGHRARFMVADELRVGYFTFPPGVKRDAEYAIWIEDMMLALPARYEGSKTVDGLELYSYVIDAEGLTVWNDSHSQPLRSGDARIMYSVEPRSGVVVDEQSQIARRYLDDKAGWATTFTSALSFTPETVAQSIEMAEELRARSRTTPAWIAWLLIGVGTPVAGASVVLLGLRRVAAGQGARERAGAT